MCLLEAEHNVSKLAKRAGRKARCICLYGWFFVCKGTKMAKRYTTFLHTKAMLNSKPNTTSAAGRYARSSMNVLQSKAMDKTFGADRNIHEAGKQACCLKTFSKSHSALQQQKDKIMFELCKAFASCPCADCKNKWRRIVCAIACASAHITLACLFCEVDVCWHERVCDKGCTQSESMGCLRHGHNPSGYERTTLNSGRRKAEIKHLQGCLVRAHRQFFKHEKAIACTLGISPNHNPRRPTTVCSGLQRGPNEGPVPGLNFGSKQASRTVR